jgi:DNA repair photolyase
MHLAVREGEDVVIVHSNEAERYAETAARHLLAPIMDGNADGSGWRLLSWDAEQGICATFQRDDTVVLLELQGRDDTRPCYARTTRFNVCARPQFRAGASMAVDARSFVDRVVALIADRESGLPRFDRPTTSRSHAVREILVNRFLVPEGGNHYYANPYAGCMIGCSFCFVADQADLSRCLEGLPRLPWGNYVDVKINAAEVLRRETDHCRPGIVRMSPILTDPYQALERRYRVTRSCLEVLLDKGFTPAILTRAARILEDLELLRRFPDAIVGFSIPTDDDRIRRIFEPGGDPIEERIEALRTFHRAGVTTVAFIQPMLAMDVGRLVEQVAPFVRAVRIDRMHCMGRMRALYQEHGLQHTSTDAYFADTRTSLAAGFAARGVAVDEMDDLTGLLDRLRSAAPAADAN